LSGPRWRRIRQTSNSTTAPTRHRPASISSTPPACTRRSCIPLVPVDRLARLYREDESVRIPLVWFQRGLISSSDPSQPLLLFGADALGRDVFSRLLSGAKLSLGVTLVGVLGALLIGGIVGAIAGTIGVGPKAASC
jgi:ABC-type dipeptide/oligopeptide/nickel transport system permease subunit